jgi:cytochrome b561/polyisoprenoid-binding protein YceI
VTATDETAGQARYSAVAIWLHWLIAGALAFQVALGFAMPRDASGFAAYQLHKSVGIAILLLTLARLAWRLAKRPPAPVESGLAALAAKAVHTGFYAVLILGPLTGWLLVSTAPVEVPTVLFGVMPWPHLPVPNGIHETSEQAHEWLSWLAIGLFLLHVAGALRHQFILRHRLLERMAPAGSMLAAWFLSALVVATGVATLLLVQPGETDRPVAAVSQPTAKAAEPAAPIEEVEIEPDDAAPEPADMPAPTWTIQPGARLAFSVGNGGEVVRGSFARWSGSIRFDPDDPGDADIRIDVDLSSASVGDSTMDATLKSAEFLAAEANPGATWRSTSVRRTAAGRYAAQGVLSLRGASRPQPLTFILAGDGLRQRVEGSAKISRTAFGIGTGPSAESLAGSVDLEFAFDAVGRRP